MNRIDLGRWGENYAAAWLQQRGWCIVGRNLHTRQGEIDLLAHRQHRLLLVEVKTRLHQSSYLPYRALQRHRLSVAWATIRHRFATCPYHEVMVGVALVWSRPRPGIAFYRAR